ncbi:response regulator [Dyadobacter subterraneus]|uniref:Response regulator n=1 Tax=Dyadobacter subterraneus TaxID=2773304 RepID=A0ABR9WDG0_9BACT|nr:response regulator [Dyadobacter subterraneus]MBE9463515.1 response regulator [Dyadobacter subterraneus]
MNSKTIYLADDDPDDRYLICDAIKQIDPGIRIVEAENGSDLLFSIQEKQLSSFDLIVLDMNMPRMNGLETLIAIRSNPFYETVPTIMISTSADPRLVESAFREGIDDFITKPTSFDEFMNLAHQLVSRFKI